MRFIWAFSLLLLLPVCSSFADISLDSNSKEASFPQEVVLTHTSLRTNTMALAGELFPKEIFDELLRSGLSHRAEEDYKTLKPISIRIEPSASANSLSRNQVEMTWQGNHPFIFHTFYDVPTEEFQTLLRGLQSFKSRASMIHDAQSNSETQEIFLAFVGANRISKITFTDSSSKTRKSKKNYLSFGEFEVTRGKIHGKL